MAPQPVTNIPNIQWMAYQGNTKNLVAQYSCDFTAALAFTFGASGAGPDQNQAGSGQAAAGGCVIDNTGNSTPVQIQVGNAFVENVPPYSKTMIQLGGTAPYVKISGTSGQCLATFYTGVYPGSIGQQNVLAATVKAIGVFLPAGIGMDWFGLVGNIPAGWLLCDGSAVSRTQFSDLFNAIGTIYGGGDGVSTFNLPDGRGTFKRGWDPGNIRDKDRNGSAANQGIVENFRDGPHYHDIPFGFTNTGYMFAALNGQTGVANKWPLFGYTNYQQAWWYDAANPSGQWTFHAVDSSPDVTLAQTTHSITMDASLQGGAQAGETRPVNIATNFIIKY